MKQHMIAAGLAGVASLGVAGPTIAPYYSPAGYGGLSGSFRNKRPCGMGKAARKKKCKAERLERQRMGARRAQAWREPR